MEKEIEVWVNKEAFDCANFVAFRREYSSDYDIKAKLIIPEQKLNLSASEIDAAIRDSREALDKYVITDCVIEFALKKLGFKND